jgi:hypothetical protein
MELLGVDVIEEDYGDGPETFEIPRYGRVLATKEVPAPLFYHKEVPLSEWIPLMLPKPEVADDEEVTIPD